jgi:hypothetical protein
MPGVDINVIAVFLVQPAPLASTPHELASEGALGSRKGIKATAHSEIR